MSREEMIEEVYEAFANWYHDDGSYDTFLKSVAMQKVEQYAKQEARIAAIAFRNWEPPVGSYNSDEDLYEIFEQSK